MHRPRTALAALATTLVLGMSAPALAHTPTPEAPPAPSASAHDNRVVKQVSIDRMMSHVSYLSETIGPRPHGTPAEAATVDYLVGQLESFGYSGVQTQTFPVGSSTGTNVIATKKPQRGHDNGQIVIVGAHHDSVANGPGANDDGTGTAAVLEIARILANTPTSAEVRFILFGAEEQGLVGSRYYASTMPEADVERTVAMFQLEMMGSRDAGHFSLLTVDGEKNTVTDLVAAASSRVSPNGILTHSMVGRSDHVPFHALGIPAAVTAHTPLEQWYHTSEDTIDKISTEKFLDGALIVAAAVFQGVRKGTPALVRSAVAPLPVDYDYEETHM